MRLVFRVSAMRSTVPMVEEEKRGPFLPRSFFFLPSRFIAACSQPALASPRPRVLCAPGPTARTEGPLCLNPRLLSLPTPPHVFFYRYFDRAIVRSRSRSPKTTAAAAAENRCSTPYNHIVVLPSPPSPPSLLLVLDILVHAKLVGTFSQRINLKIENG